MAAFTRAVSPGARKERTTNSHREGEKEEKDRMRLKLTESADSSSSAVNWMDVLKETGPSKEKKEDSTSPTAASRARQMEQLGKRQIEIKIEPASDTGATLRKGQPLGGVSPRAPSPNNVDPGPLTRSSGTIEQTVSSGKPPAQYDTVVLKRDKESSASLYVEMPSLHAWQAARDVLRANAVEPSPSAPTLPVSATSGKRRGPDDALKDWRALIPSGKVEEVRALLESMGRDFDVNVACFKGRRTALHIAAEANNIPLVRLLLASGADRNAKDSAASTPADLASSPELTEMLTNMAPAAGPGQPRESTRLPSGSGSNFLSSTSSSAPYDGLAQLQSDWAAAITGKNPAVRPDVLLVAGERSIPAHAIMLAARLPELAVPQGVRSSAGIITVQMQCSAHALEFLMEFVYGDTTSANDTIDGNDLAELFALAHSHNLHRFAALLLPLLPPVLRRRNLLRFLKFIHSSTNAHVSPQVRDMALALAAREFKNLTDEENEELLSLGKMALQIAANSATPPSIHPIPVSPERSLQRDLNALLLDAKYPWDMTIGGVGCHAVVLVTRSLGCDLAGLRALPISTRAAKALLGYVYSAQLDAGQLSATECFEVLDVLSLFHPDAARRPPVLLQQLSLSIIAALDPANCATIYLLSSRVPGEHEAVRRAALKTLLSTFTSRAAVEDFINLTKSPPAVADVIFGLSALLSSGSSLNNSASSPALILSGTLRASPTTGSPRDFPSPSTLSLSPNMTPKLSPQRN